MFLIVSFFCSVSPRGSQWRVQPGRHHGLHDGRTGADDAPPPGRRGLPPGLRTLPACRILWAPSIIAGPAPGVSRRWLTYHTHASYASYVLLIYSARFSSPGNELWLMAFLLRIKWVFFALLIILICVWLPTYVVTRHNQLAVDAIKYYFDLMTSVTNGLFIVAGADNDS